MIRLGKIDWKIKFVEAKSGVLDGALGMCVYSENTLYIADNLSNQVMREVVIHELTHAILAESNFNDKIRTLLGDFYEIFVSDLSRVIDDIADYSIINKELYESQSAEDYINEMMRKNI